MFSTKLGIANGILVNSTAQLLKPLFSNLKLTSVINQRGICGVDREGWKEQKELFRIHERGRVPKHKRRHPLDEKPQMRGVVLKTLIKKPKKPNSANRKCVLVRLTNGRESIAFVPKIGHNLQEHSVVLVQNKRTKDVPGLKLRCIRGCYDLPHVVKRSQKPS